MSVTERFDYVVVGLGGLGSAAAWELARRGHRVLGPGAVRARPRRGAPATTPAGSCGTATTRRRTSGSRRRRTPTGPGSSGSPAQQLVTRAGGLDLFPPDPAIPPIDYTQSMDEVGIAYEVLDADGDGALAAAAGARRDARRCSRPTRRSCPPGAPPRCCSEQARRLGAELRDHSPVLGLEDLGDARAAGDHDRRARSPAGGVVVTADAWVNDVVGHLGLHVPLEVTLEQVTYFAVDEPRPVRARRAAAVDLDGRPVVLRLPDLRRSRPSRPPRTAAARGRPRRPRPATRTRRWRRCSPSTCARCCPASARRVRSVRCQYTLTPDRDFVLAPVPGPRAGRRRAGRRARLQVRADLRPGAGRPGHHRRRPTTDVSAFRLDRPALTEPDYAAALAGVT